MNETPKIFPGSDQENEEASTKSANDEAAVPARRRFIATDTLVLAAIALCAGITCWHYLGPSAVEQAIRSDLRLAIQILPMIVAGLMLAGLVEILVPKELVARWLGTSSGLRGLLLATVAGAMTPGGPFSSFPIVLALQRAGADIGTMVTFITAWSVIGINRMLVWEIPFFEPDFLIIRYIASIPLPFISGLIARQLFTRMWARSEPVKS